MVQTKEHALVAALAHAQGVKLRRFFQARIRNTSDVPDLIQEVFLRMLRIPDRTAVRSPEAYLFTVALHVAQQHTLHESMALPTVDVAGLIAQLPASLDADPALQVDAEQRVEKFVHALNRLSPKIRATFLLHRQYGLTLQEISREIHISFPMAKKYLSKALCQLRRYLDTAE